MPNVVCKKCETVFYTKPNRIMRGWGLYCSNTCKHASLKTGSEMPCSNCTRTIYKTLTDQKRSQSNQFFCGKSCQAKWRNHHIATGKDHPNWKNGISSYRDLMKRQDVAKICTKCFTNDSRILAVHHKDKNRNNNDLENLTWLCHNCHFLVHHFKNESIGFLK